MRASSEYFGNVDIEMLSPFGTIQDVKYMTTLNYAYPSTVGAISLGYDTKDVSQFSVTFTYSWFTEARF